MNSVVFLVSTADPSVVVRGQLGRVVEVPMEFVSQLNGFVTFIEPPALEPFQLELPFPPQQ